MAPTDLSAGETLYLLLRANWGLVLTAVNVLIMAVLIPRIVLERRESPATLAWILGILLVPVGGAAVYWLIGSRPVRRRRLRRMRSKRSLEGGLGAARRLRAPFETDVLPPDEAADARALFSPQAPPPDAGNRVDLLTDAHETYGAMEAAIEAARRHVHLQSYIFRPDATGRRFLKLLERAASRGAETRLLVDALGAWDLSEDDVAALRRAGGRVERFAPVSPLRRRWSVNLRNHRKILVADGRVGFVGGLNVGDEYRGRAARLAPWRDTHLRIEGPAAERLQEIFAEDWHFASGEALTAPAYFPEPVRAGDSAVQIVASGPDEGAEPIHRAVFVAITQARRRAWLTTPYFVPDRALVVALETAARRGVDVRLLLPGRSDLWLVLQAGRAFYRFLLESGCRVREYQAGILHAKTLVVDDAWATVGSANMDRRSFALNWEANAVVYDRDFAARAAARFEEDWARSAPATLPKRGQLWRRSREAVAYALAPLL